MSQPEGVGFLLDCDNTLLDNDLVQADLQVHLARDGNVAAFPAADLTIERIGDLVEHDLSALPGAP